MKDTNKQAMIDRRKAARLCIYCGNPLSDTKHVSCESCRTKRNAYNRKLYHDLKSSGICVDCGSAFAAKGHVSCLNCLEARQVKRMLHPREKTEEDRRHIREYNRELYNKRKAQGVCVKCGKPLYSNSSIYCIDHHFYYKKLHNNSKSTIKKDRRLMGVCIQCGKPVTTKLDGSLSKLCEEHYKRACVNLSCGPSPKTHYWRQLNELLFMKRGSNEQRGA